MKKVVLSICLSFTALVSSAQNENDSIANDTVKNSKFNYRQLIIPGVLVGYGVIGIESDQLKGWNNNIRKEVVEDIDEKLTIDDFTQWAPAASVFALDAFGVKGKNSFRDKTIIMATSYLIMSTTVLGLKSITKVERPDGSSNNSFPSGHTATAFAGAEFLWQEYKDKSIWYGVAGYAVATGTGLFRIYNNRHWLTDVAAGAGIGILSTKAAYWLYPFINNTLFGGGKESQKKSSAMLMPSYDGKFASMTFVKRF